MSENNSILNIAGLFLAFMSVLIFFFGLGVTDALRVGVNASVTNETRTSMLYSSIDTSYTDLRETLVKGINFILLLIVLFAFYSSFMYRADFESYLINFIGGIALGGVMLYIMTAIYNSFTGAASGFIDVSELPAWFFGNLTHIILVNIIAGTLSFVMVRRGEVTQQ